MIISTNLIKYEDVRQQVIDFLKENSDYSATFDWSASNINYIIDTLTYMTMMLSYQQTTITNNNFLDTTSIRKNAVSLAKTIGYRPKRKKSSIINAKIKYVDPSITFDSDKAFTENTFIKVKAKSTFVSNTGRTYYNPKEIVFSFSNYNTLEGLVSLKEGNFKTLSYLGTGLLNQEFILPSKDIEEDSLEVYLRRTDDLTSKIKLSEVKNAFNVVDKNIFFVEEDVENELLPKIVFGNDIIGIFPRNHETIEVYYTETVGDLANGEYIVSLPTNEDSFYYSNDLVSIDKTKFVNWTSNQNILSFGGKPYETLSEIKSNSPKHYAMSGRVVTKNDFKFLLSGFNDIFIGNAIGGEELYENDITKLGHIYLSLIPYINNKDFFSNAKIYLKEYDEQMTMIEFQKYNIISTKLEFIKPSYIYIDIKPYVEFVKDIALSTEIFAKDNIKKNLDYLIENNFSKFEVPFRVSKIKAEIDRVNEVLSSTLETDFYFIINYDMFYTINANNNFIFLPKKTLENDKTISFVQSNLEKSNLFNIDINDLTFNQRTIYGKISNTNIDRYLYNEDILYVEDEVNKTVRSKIKLDGRNNFFKLFRADENLNFSIIDIESIKQLDDISLEIIKKEDVLTIDEFEVNHNGFKIGTISRNNNFEYFKGPISYTADIYSEPEIGFYHEITSRFYADAESNQFFGRVDKGDIIIYRDQKDGENTGLGWYKVDFKGEISAVTDEFLYTVNNQNDIFGISVSGSFEGILQENDIPVVATPTDYIIFNTSSIKNPDHKWEKITYINETLDATIQLPESVSPYDIRIVYNMDYNESTTFGSRCVSAFYDEDLIIYNPAASSEFYAWTKLLNLNNTSSIQSISASSSTDLDQINYSTLPLFSLRKVSTSGDFSGSEKVIWLDETINSALDGDILIYIGTSDNPKWLVYSNLLFYKYAIDGHIPTSLPKVLTYGDTFVVEGSGNFNGTSLTEYIDNDKIIYVDNNQWMKLPDTVLSLDASVASSLPAKFYIGELLRVNEDGSFNNSSYIYNTSVSGLNDTFVDGDYILNIGSKWIKAREYTFSYSFLIPDLSGKDYLNRFGFNSVFDYEFNPEKQAYYFFFRDIYDGVQIGEFKYEAVGQESSFEVSKLQFFNQIKGKYNSITETDLTYVRSLFSNTIDRIKIEPRRRINEDELSSEVETDFDTIYNQFILLNFQEIENI